MTTDAQAQEGEARRRATEQYWKDIAHQDMAEFILRNPGLGRRLVYELHQHFQRGSLLAWATRSVRDELKRCCKKWVDKNWEGFV